MYNVIIICGFQHHLEANDLSGLYNIYIHILYTQTKLLIISSTLY